MKMKVFTSISVMGALGLFATMPAHALGLGKIELSSALNEPFRAEIPVNAIQGDEAESLQVRLASNAEFERAGLIKNAVISELKFDVIQKAGKTVIAVTSKTAVKEPLLDFLLLAKSDNGQLIREYTVLLDPPKSMFKQPVRAAKVAPISQDSQPSSVNRPPVSSSRVQSGYTAPPLAGASQYGPTGRTDTLWDVALKTRPTRDVSVHQMMLALVEKNSAAFIRQNINGLKSGYTLTIPTSSEISRLTQQQAKAAVQQHNTAWKNRHTVVKEEEVIPKVEAVDTVVESASLDEPTETQGVATNDVVTDEAEAPNARLQLLGSDEDTLLGENDLAAFGNEQIKTLSDQLTIAQEVIESQQQENVDIKSRMAAMEEQIQTLRKLISLQDPDLARLQSKLEQETGDNASTLQDMSEALQNALTEGGATTEEVTAETVTTPVTTDPAIDIAVENDPKKALTTTASDPVAMAADASELAATSAANAPPSTLPATTLEKIQGFFIANKMTALFAGLAFLLGLLFLNRKKTENGGQTWNEAVKDIDNEAQATVAPAAVVSPLIPVDHNANIETDAEPAKTVDDLISDADIYTGYGDFDKAENALTAAYDDAPSNMVVIQKLLFNYYKQAKTTAFVELAREYIVDRESMEWSEVAAWGRELAPDNAMFDEPVVIDEPVVDEVEPVVENTDPEAGLAFDISSGADDLSTLDSETTGDEMLPVEDDSLLDFTLDVDVDETAISDNREQVSSDEGMPVDNDLPPSNDSDDLEFERFESLSENELEEATIALADSHDDLAFDLEDFDEVDETETKLDLASAYIDMGDPEGAKSILQEVLKEGSDEQKSRAEALLNDLP